MKNLIILLIAIFSFAFCKAQSIISITPENGQEISVLNTRMPVTAVLDSKAYAVVFSIDAIGPVRLLRKNKALWAGVTFWTNDNTYELTAFLDGIQAGMHTFRVDVYSDSKTIVDSKEITFTVY